MSVFSNTTPFIALASIGQLKLLPQLFDKVHVAESVIDECAEGGRILAPDLRSMNWTATRPNKNKFMPGSRIPIVDEARLQAEKPDYVVILPWNLKTEVVRQLAYIRAWGGQFVMAVPELAVV